MKSFQFISPLQFVPVNASVEDFNSFIADDAADSQQFLDFIVSLFYFKFVTFLNESSDKLRWSFVCDISHSDSHYLFRLQHH